MLASSVAMQNLRKRTLYLYLVHHPLRMRPGQATLKSLDLEPLVRMSDIQMTMMLNLTVNANIEI